MEAKQILSISELQDFLQNRQPLIVDLRGRSEFDLAHLNGAVHLDFVHQNVVSFFEGVDRSTPVLLYCKNGTRCKSMVRLLGTYGFDDLHFVANGIGLWQEEIS